MIPKDLDPNVPNIARIYDYMLGGKDNFGADCAAAEQISAAFPEAPEGVRQNRVFLRQAVSYLAGRATAAAAVITTTAILFVTRMLPPDEDGACRTRRCADFEPAMIEP
jgi:hypothetical protein